jgi:hypothetical protein
MTPMDDPDPAARHDGRASRRAERVEAFVYGTIATLIAMAGFEALNGHEPVAAGAIILVSALATWWAHAFSEILGAEVGGRHHVTPRFIANALRTGSPIVIAAIPATVFSAMAVQGFWPLRTAIVISNVTGIVVMGIAGLAAARVTKASPVRTIVWVVVTTAIGGTIVLVEAAVHQ